MGMTWKFKALRVGFALAIVAALAMASGANWWEFVYNFFW
jgi:hypothetical protein